jgi:hypothetical protein
MISSFDYANIISVEFGVSFDTDDGEVFRLIPIVEEVQDALKEMLDNTKESLSCGAIDDFSPAEKYASTERLKLALDSDMATKHRQAYQAENLEMDTYALELSQDIVGYFSIFRDRRGHKLMAFKRATHFKGILRKKLIHFIDDAIRLLPDDVFKLDQDFDFLIHDNQIFISHPSGFEFSADIERYVATCALESIKSVSKRISCVNFDQMKDFIKSHKRAMRLVAAIKSRDDLEKISSIKLKVFCAENKVPLTESKGKLWPVTGHELQFLMVLDRRRYTVTLIENEPETYEAPSRKRTEL